jgi:hypothetical protein
MGSPWAFFAARGFLGAIVATMMFCQSVQLRAESDS